MIAAALLLAAAPAVAAAQGDTRTDPDWPCVQRKIPSLTPAAIWTGPAVEDAANWRTNREIPALVDRLSQRRVPLEEAEAEIRAFAEALPPDEREARLTALFAGLFETMDAERSEIIEGIERYARKQKALAERIREETARQADSEPGANPEAEQKLYWDRRIFEERRRSVSFICEVPRLVEQRLFSLGRAIQQASD